jgi:hypothetical protein
VHASLPGDAGARSVPYLGGVDGRAVEYPERSGTGGTGVRAVEGAVDVQGRGEAGRALGQFLVVANPRVGT